MHRPKYRNAQSRVLLEDLDAAFAEAMADHDVRVVVLFGSGDHWSSGHDIGTPEELADREARPYPPGLLGVHQRSWDWNVENTLRWRDLPKPTLAAVQGMCIYGGWMIAAAMDLIVAADDARFIPFLFQYQSVPWDIGARRAKDIMWEQRLVDAEQGAGGRLRLRGVAPGRAGRAGPGQGRTHRRAAADRVPDDQAAGQRRPGPHGLPHRHRRRPPALPAGDPGWSLLRREAAVRLGRSGSRASTGPGPATTSS